LILHMLKYNADERYTVSQILKHSYFKDLRDGDVQQMSGITAGPAGFTKSISSNL
jgi:serine/threonine protein kinase